MKLDENTEGIILEFLKSTYEKRMKDNEVSFGERILNSLTMQLVPIVNSEELLEDIPYRKIGDMALVYTAVISLGRTRIGRAVITNDLMKKLGLDLEELHWIAKIKSPINMPPKVQFLESMVLNQRTSGNGPVLVVSSVKKENGAAVLMYPGVMEQCSNILNGNYYVLPSSVNEMILYPSGGEVTLSSLKKIVQRTGLLSKEQTIFLSDKIYHYDWNTKKLELADDYEKRLAGKKSYE